MVDKDREEQFLKQVENAAKKGASKGVRNNSFISLVITIVLVLVIVLFIGNKMDNFKEDLKQFVTFEDPSISHDLILDDDAFLGYTAADFEEAIITNSTKIKKIEVYEQEVSDTVTLTDTGLFNWAIFSKCQLIVYKGNVVYTVDMSDVDIYDIKVDNDNKIISLYIPYPVQEAININENDIQFGDVEKGLLAFGDIGLTIEQASQIQEEARNKMQMKLDDTDAINTAMRFGKLVVWEMYSPIVKSVAKDYSLEVSYK